MKASERRLAILDIVLAGEANVEQLSARFAVSEATVRRDLAALAGQGRIVRTYGGAAAVIGRHEPEASAEVRNALHRAEKEAIARLAADLVGDGETLILDVGTTTSALARQLDGRRDLHVVTNNLDALDSLAVMRDVQVTLLGGQLRPTSHGTVGPLAELVLRRISADRLFLGADGIVAGYGLCEASAEQAYLKECMIRQSAEVYVLADASKLGQAVQQHWTPLDRHWTLITDASATEAQLVPFRELRHVTVMVARPELMALSA